MAAFLSSEGLQKSFDGTRVLEDVHFNLKRGECLVLLGPSGCGKSTLLNILSGMLETDAGCLSCDGVVLDEPATRKHVGMRARNFSMVFQDFSLWPHMTVAENVAFGLRIKGVGRSERESRIKRALDQVQMSAFSKRMPAQLSGGQQQRVAIARALVVKPRLILLDEPLSALDARLREDLKLEIASLLKENHLTAVYVTHDQAEAFSLGDQVALMNQGRIEQLDRPEVVYTRPATRFAASFIGNSNIFAYERNHDGLRLESGFSLPAKPDLDTPEKGHVCIRREAVQIFSGRAANCNNGHISINASCKKESFLGDRIEIHAEVDAETVFRGYSEIRLNPGDPVYIRIDPHALHFLEH